MRVVATMSRSSLEIAHKMEQLVDMMLHQLQTRNALYLPKHKSICTSRSVAKHDVFLSKQHAHNFGTFLSFT
jgi:hypothetical protein